jgi:hypothetical protein
MYILVQLGQCGNQVGCALLDAVYPSAKFFRTAADGTVVARAVAIDTEHKVVQALPSEGRFVYAAKNRIVGSRLGAGNNWAFGCVAATRDSWSKVQSPRPRDLAGRFEEHSAGNGAHFAFRRLYRRPVGRWWDRERLGLVSAYR